MRSLERLKAWAKTLKRDVMVLWFVLRHPATPWGLRALAALVTAYALSPIDLIPDFIPVLGYLDDLLVLPLGVWLLLKMVPASILADSRERASHWLAQSGRKPSSRAGLLIIVLLWLLGAWAMWQLIAR